MRKKLKTSTIRSRMLVIAALILFLVCVFVAVLFFDSTNKLRDKAMESMHYTGHEIARNVDGILSGVQFGSETLADSERLFEIVGNVYSGEERQSKKSDLLYIQNSIFDSFNRRQSITQIAALYNNNTNELFNFFAGNKDDAETVSRILSMGAADSENLSRYIWYPLQDNFLADNAASDARKSNVIFGSRRIYRHETLTYPVVQIFAIEENTLFLSYENTLKPTGGDVFVLDADGMFLSSSRMECVERRAAPQVLVDTVLGRAEDSFTLQMNGVKYFVNVSVLENRISETDAGNWIAVLLVPQQTVLRDVYQLYGLTFSLLLAFFVVCGGLIGYMYNQFMKPISELGTAMNRVDSGDLDAYVQCKGTQSETDLMLQRYNLMLQNINMNIAEKVQFERIKRELDMQVLTNQINPHFLYNTLETIVWKAHESDRPDIGKIASSLGKLYRLTVKGDRTWTTLQNEIDHVKSYVDIQAARYEGLFEYECRIAEELADLRIPKLVLQPIVENVFLHAIEKKGERMSIRDRRCPRFNPLPQGGYDPTCVRFRVGVRRCKDGTVEIKVVDNGPGMDAARLAKVRADVSAAPELPVASPELEQSGSIGLRNVAARLRLYMGEKEPIRICSKVGWGTKVVIRLNPKECRFGDAIFGG